MKHFLKILMVVFLFTPICFAGNPYLFGMLRGNQRSFVLGTAHIGVSLKSYPAYVKGAIEASKTVTFESPHRMGFIAKCATLVSLLKIVRFRGPNYSRALSPDAYNVLKHVYDKKQLPMSFAEFLSPFVVSALLDSDLSSIERGQLEPEIAAISTEKKLTALEKVSFQAGILSNGMSIEQLEKELLNRKDELMSPDPKPDFAAVFLEGQLNHLEMQYQKMKASHPELAAQLIDHRNLSWIPKITQQFERNVTFFAVGALHLVGDEGLLKLLQKEGIEIVRINSESELHNFLD